MYAQYLARLLAPLGVYELREDSVSGAMVCALGEALDAVQAKLQTDLADAFPQSAADVSQWERVLPRHGNDPDPEHRRAALLHLLGQEDVACSAAAIEAALAACGIPAALEMSDGNRVTVTAPAGTQNIAEHYHLIRGLIPAHLDIRWEQSP